MAKSKRTMKKAAIKASAKRIPNIRAKFSQLTPEEQRVAASAVIGGLRRLGFFGRGGYKVVHGPDQVNRPRISAETSGEIGQLTISERNRLIAFARNAARNSERLEGILHQLEINVIGTFGGKAVFEFPKPYAEAGEKVKRAFVEWAREAEYFDDLDLQDTLKLALRTQMLGGDCVFVFDDDILADSTGQIISFEPDCIGDVEGFERDFPGYTQHQGIVKNANGKTVGVTVSWAQRGQSEYKRTDGGKLAAWTLIRKPGERKMDAPFIVFHDQGRFNQIRGSSRLWPGLGTIVDLADTQGFEVQAAKNGAQKLGQIIQDQEQNKGEIDSELDNDVKAPIAGAEVIDEALRGEKKEDEDEDDREKLELDTITNAGVLWDVLPSGVRMELFDTKHPNDKLVEFMTSLHGAAAFAIGLGKANATGEASSSYSASMVELMLSSIEFDDEFHKLEKNLLDWVLMRWSKWAQRRGIIPKDDALPADWRRTCVIWQRPTKRAIDPVKEQQALAMGLKNGTILYREKWGPDWRAKLTAFHEELEAFRAAGVPHPADQTVSGSLIETTNNAETGKNGEE